MSNIRLLKISGNLIYLTREIFVDINKINLSKGGIKFRTVGDIYLTVEVKSFNNITKSLFVKVIDYKPQEISSFNEQKTTSEIRRIYFDPVIWTEFEPLLSVYIKTKLIKEKLIIDNSHVIQKSEFSKPKTSYEVLNYPISQGYLEANPVIKEISEEFDVYFKHATFNLGFVSFSYKSKLLNKTVDLKIENPYIQPEFNNIKSFFPKALGGNKKFKVTAKYILKNDTVTSAIALSGEIDKINNTIIESIKTTRILKLTTKPIVTHPDKALFTTDDILSIFETNFKSDSEHNFTDEEVLKTILGNKKIRNAKNLQYLSGSEQSATQKLRFTIKPLFGFLFFIERKTKDHFCWELLNSHATYLWSFDKLEFNILQQFDKMNETINTIRATSREKYKAAYRAKEIDNDIEFCIIEHVKINSDSVDGFIEWKQKLREHLE